MIAWSPTAPTGDRTGAPASNGYDYDVIRLRGFSLTHVNGAGCAPGPAGDVSILPFAGPVDSSPTADTRDAEDTSTVTPADETATTGRYAVIRDSGVRANLAVSTRAAVGGFTFPAGRAADLLFRTSNSLNGSKNAGVHARGTWRNSERDSGGTTIEGGEGYPARPDRAGQGSGGRVGFASATDSDVGLRLGISCVSAKGAAASRKAEIPTGSTPSTVGDAERAAWNAELKRVRVGGSTASFYAAVYYALMQPQTMNDVDGQVWAPICGCTRSGPDRRRSMAPSPAGTSTGPRSSYSDCCGRTPPGT